MRHNREEVIERTIREYELLDQLVANLSDEDWDRLLRRPETKDPWTVKDALAHTTHWKADVARSIMGRRRPSVDRNMPETAANHLIYLRWRDRPVREILAWHRQVHEDVLAALIAAPEEWFSNRERRPDWPYDLDGHCAYHRIKDIEWALALKAKP